jgi:hypothetical protein
MVLTATADSTIMEAFPSDSILAVARADSLRQVQQQDSLLRLRVGDSVRTWLRDSTARALAGQPQPGTPASSAAPAGRDSAPTP